MGPEIKGNENTKQSGTIKVKQDLYMPLAVVRGVSLKAKAPSSSSRVVRRSRKDAEAQRTQSVLYKKLPSFAKEGWHEVTGWSIQN